MNVTEYIANEMGVTVRDAKCLVDIGSTAEYLFDIANGVLFSAAATLIVNV